MSEYYRGYYDFQKPLGWICPKCDAVMAPSTPCCFYCGPKTLKTPTNTGELEKIK